MRRHVSPYSYMLVCFLFVVLLAGCGTPVPAGNAVAAAPAQPTAIMQSSPTAGPPSTARPTPTPAVASAPAVGAAEDLDPAHDLAALGDEFDDPRSLASWKDLAQVEGFPNWIEQLDVNATSPGELYLVPRQSGWFEDFRGVYLYKEVTGDFDVTTRILANGKQDELPTLIYSLSGIMVRAPRAITMESWEPGQENWMFITTGYGDNHPGRAGKRQIEIKTTQNSRSVLRLVPVKGTYIDLRVVRVGATFVMLFREEGKPWRLAQRYHRPDMPASVQVGLNAYSSGSVEGNDERTYNSRVTPPPGDLIVRADYVRFRRPALSTPQQARFADRAAKNAELLALIGE